MDASLSNNNRKKWKINVFVSFHMTIGSESGRSDMERALRLMILYHPCKFESYILATFYEKIVNKQKKK